MIDLKTLMATIATWAPGLNPNAIYASPLGDDDDDGLSWETAVEHGYVGYDKLVSQGGGTLNIASGTHWGGPVTGQGVWIRNDNLWNVIPGWQKHVSVVFQGHGAGDTGLPNPFQKPGAAILYAGSNDAADFRLKPATWQAMCQLPMDFRNIMVFPTPGHTDGQIGNYQPFRKGWDYNRNADGTLMYQAVTNSVRTGTIGVGSTVHTVHLAPAVSSFQVSRTSNTTTVGVGSGVAAPPPWTLGTKVWVEFSAAAIAAGFVSGAYGITHSRADTLDDFDWSFSFSDTGSDVAPFADTSTTVRSIVSAVGNLIDLESADADFPSTQYRVTGTTIIDGSTGTITVRDTYGGTGGIPTTKSNTANIGRLVHQERALMLCVGGDYTNCTSFPISDDTKYTRVGPMFDFAGETAFAPTMHDCFVAGYFPTVASGLAPAYDDMRMSAILVMGGTPTPASLRAYNLTGTQASVRAVMQAGTTSELILKDFVFDCNNGAGEAPGAYVIDGDSACTVTIQDVVNADFSPGFGPALNRITGIPPIRIRGNGTGVAGEALGPSNNEIPGGDSNPDSTVSPWVNLSVGTWADLQITGKHPAAWRHVSPTYRRFEENVLATSSWSPAPAATGISDPMGGTGAVRYDDTNAGAPHFQNVTVFSFQHTFTFSPGDYLVFSGWVNASANGFAANTGTLVGVTASGSIVWESGSTSWSGAPPFWGPGWQYVSFKQKVVSSSGAVNITAGLVSPAAASGGTLDFFGWNLEQIKVSEVTANDAAEYIGTRGSVPQYLAAGHAGTFENQPFIAHGGLGTGNAYVEGTAQGELTIVGSFSPKKYEPILTSDGKIKGFTELLHAYVNIPPPSLWLKSDAGVTLDGSNVTNWADQSGNGNNVSQASGPVQPTFNASSINSLPGITFTGGTQALTNLSTSIVAAGHDRTIIAVVKPSGIAGGSIFSFDGDTGLDSNWVLEDFAGTQYVWSDGVKATHAITLVDYTATPIVIEFTGVVGDLPGVAINSAIIPVTGDVVTTETGSTGFAVGSRLIAIGASQGWQGDIAEVLVYDRVLSEADLTTIRGYLQFRYNIALGV